MKLYFSPGACSLSPHIVAQELGIPLTLAKVDIGTKKVADGSDFWAINPKGYVPALGLDNGGDTQVDPGEIFDRDRWRQRWSTSRIGRRRRYCRRRFRSHRGVQLFVDLL